MKYRPTAHEHPNKGDKRRHHSRGNAMEQALSRMDGGEIVGLIASVTALLSFAAVAMSAIIAPRWKEVRRAECELKLKSDLVTAGYSADDIERHRPRRGDPDPASQCRSRLCLPALTAGCKVSATCLARCLRAAAGPGRSAFLFGKVPSLRRACRGNSPLRLTARFPHYSGRASSATTLRFPSSAPAVRTTRPARSGRPFRQ